VGEEEKEIGWEKRRKKKGKMGRERRKKDRPAWKERNTHVKF